MTRFRLGLILLIALALVVWVGREMRDERGPEPLEPDASARPQMDLALVEQAGERAPIAVNVGGALGLETGGASAPAFVLFGTVVAADTGLAVPGASFELREPSEEDEATRSSVDGSFELASATRLESVALAVEAEGFPEQHFEFRLPIGEVRVRADLRLLRGLHLRGRVVDFESGAGIPGAELSGSTVDGLVSDANGAFDASVLPIGAGLALVDFEVNAPGFCRLSVALTPADLAAPLELRLPRCTRVEGHVSDAAGRQVSGAWVELDLDHAARARARDRGSWPAPSPLDALHSRCSYEPGANRGSRQTDEQGRFLISNAVPWQAFAELRVTADGFERLNHPLECLAGPDEVLEVELVLAAKDARPTVRGELVLNGHSQGTLQGRVRWRGATRSGAGPISDGRFELADVERGDDAFELELEGFARAPDGSRFTLRIDGDRERRVELSTPTRSIAGHVRLDDGRPASEASVTASCAPAGPGEDWTRRLRFSTEAAQDGAYRLEVPDEEWPYRVEAELDSAECALEGVRAGASDVELVLPRAGVLQFRFRDERGTLLSPGPFEVFWRTEAEAAEQSLDRALPPDAQGWYEQRLPRGRVELWARETGDTFGFLQTPAESVWIDPDAPRQVEFLMRLGSTVELRLAPGEAALPGEHQIFLLEDERAAEVRVDAAQNSWHEGSLGDALWYRVLAFDARGTATIRGLAPGPCRFKVFPDDLVLEPLEVLAGAGHAEPVLVRWRERR